MEIIDLCPATVALNIVVVVDDETHRPITAIYRVHALVSGI